MHWWTALVRALGVCGGGSMGVRGLSIVAQTVLGIHSRRYWTTSLTDRQLFYLSTRRTDCNLLLLSLEPRGQLSRQCTITWLSDSRKFIRLYLCSWKDCFSWQQKDNKKVRLGLHGDTNSTVPIGIAGARRCPQHIPTAPAVSVAGARRCPHRDTCTSGSLMSRHHRLRLD